MFQLRYGFVCVKNINRICFLSHLSPDQRCLVCSLISNVTFCYCIKQLDGLSLLWRRDTDLENKRFFGTGTIADISQ